MTTQAKNNQTRGRPSNPDKQYEQKRKLIQAAAALLSNQSYRSITIRQLGDTAGVNSAMIRYYFNNKEGLFVALLDHMSSEHFQAMESVMTSENPIKEFIMTMLAMLNQNGGLARMIHDEIMQSDSPLKQAFLERFPKRMASLLPRLIEQQIKMGKMRANLNPKYTAFTLMGLIVLPYVAAPIREEAWNIGAEELARETWAEHIYQLFMIGSQLEKNNE
jgi:AcrR family transcriptional regulator